MYAGYSADGQQQQMRRDGHAIAIQAVQERRVVQSAGGNQRYSPREAGGQSSGGNGSTAVARSYHQGSSPVLVATSEEYEGGGGMAETNVGVQLDSPAPPSYSPPIGGDGGIRATATSVGHQQPGQQHQMVTGYVNTGGVSIKYETEAANVAATNAVVAAAAAVGATVPVDGIKVSSTYTTLETVPIPPSQAVQYQQYISASETFQQAPTYSYTKPGDQVIFAYPSQLSSRVPGVSRLGSILFSVVCRTTDFFACLSICLALRYRRMRCYAILLRESYKNNETTINDNYEQYRVGNQAIADLVIRWY